MFEEMRRRFVIGVILGALIVSLFILLRATENVLLTAVAVQLIFYIVLPIPFLGYHFKKRGMTLRNTLFFRGTSHWLLPVCGLTVLVLLFSMSIYWLMLRALMVVSPRAANFALTPQPLPDAVWYLIATGFILAVIAPFVEEFVFRGVILHRLMATFGFWKGIGLSSLIFAIFHINFFGAFLFAVAASLLYLKSGNLLVPILLHMANNAIAVYQSYINPSFPDWLTATNTHELYTKAAPNLLVLVVSTALLLFIIDRMAKGLDNKTKPIE